MNVTLFQQYAPLAAGVLLAAALLGFLIAVFNLRSGRRDPTWRYRREAGQRGGRLLLISLFAMFISALICGSNFAVGLVIRRNQTPTPITITPFPTETPTIPPTLTPIPSPTLFIPTSAPLATELPTETHTFTPTFTPTIDPSISPTVTPTETDTPTPTETFTPTKTPLPTLTPTITARPLGAAPLSSVTPFSNARLLITALDTQLSATFTPVTAGTVFKAGFTRLYYFVSFNNMANGSLWRGELYFNGSLLMRFERLWGTTVNGTGYFFFSQESGFMPGDYEIKLYIGNGENPVTNATFKVE
jgi:hypothetical protein